MASTAAWSAPFLSPRPMNGTARMAAASVARTSSIARLRSGWRNSVPVSVAVFAMASILGRWSDAPVAERTLSLRVLGRLGRAVRP